MTFAKKFAIGRYHFPSLFKDQANKSFLEDLTKKPFFEEKNFGYALGNFTEEEYEGKAFLRATFGRLRKDKLVEVYDKHKKEFRKELMVESADVMLEFIISHEDHLIFVEYNYLIKPSQFVNKFKRIYSLSSSVAKVEIDFIFIEKDIFDSIKRWQRIEKVSFKKLRPSNPTSYDYFEEIEELLKETNSEKTRIDFEASSKEKEKGQGSGLNYKSKLIRQGIALSAHGYGEAKLKGIEDGEKKEVSSKRFLKKIEIDFTKEGALKKIRQTIEEIKNNENNER